MRGVFVTGTDTGVGKTVVSAALLASFPATRYVKPVQTGWPADDDVAMVRRLAQVDALRAPAVGARLAEPCSPHHAAALEGAALSVAGLCDVVTAAADGAAVVVEGAGGLLVPLSARERIADLIAWLGLPVVVTVAVRLGAINATLLTLEALTARRLRAVCAVLVGAQDPSLTTALAAFAPELPRLALPRLPDLSPRRLAEAASGWSALPGLREALT